MNTHEHAMMKIVMSATDSILGVDEAIFSCYKIGVTQTSTGENIMSMATTIAERILSLPQPLRIIIGIIGIIGLVVTI